MPDTCVLHQFYIFKIKERYYTAYADYIFTYIRYHRFLEYFNYIINYL